jgi:hypothetical protein
MDIDPEIVRRWGDVKECSTCRSYDMRDERFQALPAHGKWGMQRHYLEHHSVEARRLTDGTTREPTIVGRAEIHELPGGGVAFVHRGPSLTEEERQAKRAAEDARRERIARRWSTYDRVRRVAIVVAIGAFLGIGLYNAADSPSDDVPECLNIDRC